MTFQWDLSMALDFKTLKVKHFPFSSRDLSFSISRRSSNVHWALKRNRLRRCQISNLNWKMENETHRPFRELRNGRFNVYQSRFCAGATGSDLRRYVGEGL